MNSTVAGPLRLIAAPFTAFGADGSLDLDPIHHQVQSLRAGGVSGAFVCGTTGECGSLTLAERERVAERWAAEADGLDVIVHVGHSCQADARRLAAHAQDLNVSGIASVGPYYHRPDGTGALVEWCERVAAEAPGKPFFYYHIPSLTGVSVPMDEFFTAARERIPTFAGIKFTHDDFGELARCLELAEESPGEQEIFFGRDETLLAALALGVRSAVGSTYNFAAPVYLALDRALRSGDRETARRMQAVARRMIETAVRFGGPPALKALAGMIGPDLGGCRLPQPTLDEAQSSRLRVELDGDGFFSALAAATS